MKLSLEAKPRRARIDMVPLMDTMFLLLVFFIYAMMSMVVHQGIPLTLPAAVTAAITQRPYAAVSITAKGDLFINKVKTDEAGVVAHLVKLRDKGQQPDIYVSADVDAAYGRIMSILDQLRAHGFYNISFETQAVSNGR